MLYVLLFKLTKETRQRVGEARIRDGGIGEIREGGLEETILLLRNSEAEMGGEGGAQKTDARLSRAHKRGQN
jgi:hypothetical protein